MKTFDFSYKIVREGFDCKLELKWFQEWLIRSVFWIGVFYGKQHKYIALPRPGTISCNWFLYYGCIGFQICCEDVLVLTEHLEYKFTREVAFTDVKKIEGEVLSLVEMHYPGIIFTNRIDECAICKRTKICVHMGIDLICHSCREKTKVADNDKSGFVYIAGNEDTGYYKIGYSNNPDYRVKSFTPQLPFEIKVLHQIYAKDASEAEKAFHRMFSKKRKRGEWFILSEEDLAKLKTIKEYVPEPPKKTDANDLFELFK